MVSLIVSVLIFVFGIIFSFYTIKKYRKTTKTSITYLMVTVFLSLLPLYISGNSNSKGGPIDVLFTAILGVVRSITGENSVFDTREMLLNFPIEASVFVLIYTALLHICCTLLLFGVILGFFQNFFPIMKYHIFAKHNLYIFSEICERSLLLAEDIKFNKNNKDYEINKKSTIVFLGDLKPEVDERALELNRRVVEVGALVLNMNLCDFKIHQRFFAKSVRIFLIKDNEEENLKDFLKLREKYQNCTVKDNKKHSFYIHVLNATPEAEAFSYYLEFSNYFKLRFIHETQIAIHTLFDKKPLFLGARENKMKILVIGAGKTGLEAVKIASWCGQTLNLSPEIVVIDKNPEIESRFQLQCPELAPKTATENSKKYFNIKFYTANVETAQFSEILKENPDIGYVICSLGKDELNLRCAMQTREIFNKINSANTDLVYENIPLINIQLEDPFFSSISSNLKLNPKVEYKLSSFGGFKELYNLEAITNNCYDKMGQQVNRLYGRHFQSDCLEGLNDKEYLSKLQEIDLASDNDYEAKEYNRLSSVAMAIHSKYKAYACLWEENNIKFDFEKTLDKEVIYNLKSLLNDDVITKLAQLEHRRWNYYQRSLGWEVASFSQMDKWYEKLKDRRNFSAKLHPSLVEWDQLDDLSEYLRENYGVNEDYYGMDKMIVKKLPEILEVLI